MINVRQELSNYSPIIFDSEIEAGVSEKVKSSALLYNKALESLKNDSEDMAVIELKKALSMNPDFPEAMNLLGLCYIYTKDYPKASSIFDQVIANENNGVNALRYLNAINGNDQGMSAAGKRKNIAGMNEPGNSLVKDMINIKANWKRDALKYASGIVAGALIVFVIQVVFFSGGKGAKTVLAQNDSTIAAQTDDPGSSGKDYESLKKENDRLLKDLEAANKEVSYYQNVSKLNDIRNLFSQKKYEEAADLLVLLKSAEFKDSDKQKYGELYAQVIPNALWVVMGNGINLFSAAKYQEAIQKLNKVPLYNDKWESIDRVYYYVGKSYFGLNDSKNALETFKKIVADFPQSKYAAYSTNYINQLTKTP